MGDRIRDLVPAESGSTCDLCHAPAFVVDLAATSPAFFCAEHQPDEGAI